jgi:hypothetical protein
MSYRSLQHEFLMALRNPDEFTRVLKELDEAINETARLQEAVDGTPLPPHAAPHDDRRRNQRRGVVNDRRNADRRGTAPGSDG